MPMIRLRCGGMPVLFAALLCGVGSVPALASVLPERPALVVPASNEHHPGKIVYVQLMTPDLNAAKRFYAALFGWTFQDLPMGHTHFAQASLDGQQVAGLMERPLPAGAQRRPAWLTFISARDVDATRSLAEQHGAKVLLEPRTIPGFGRIAVFSDPQGAAFAVLASSSGDPPDIQADDGEWIWSSLITSDPQADAAFYRTLFGYETYDLASSGEPNHLILASDSFARASVNPFPSDRPNAHPRWVNYVRVEDVAAMAAKVTSLGGHVLVPPRVDRDGDMIAIMADPLGAIFGLFQWTGSNGPGAPK
jgi:uncharacterized protein